MEGMHYLLFNCDERNISFIEWCAIESPGCITYATNNGFHVVVKKPFLWLEAIRQYTKAIEHGADEYHFKIGIKRGYWFLDTRFYQETVDKSFNFMRVRY